MTTQRQAGAFIASRTPFAASALRGIIEDDRYSFDRMRADEREAMLDALRREEVDYIVLSYLTPIAYHTTTDGWIVCKQKHSVTTSKHTGIVRRAISHD